MPTAMIFKSFILSSYLLHCFVSDIQRNWIKNMTLQMYGNFIAVFALLNKKHIQLYNDGENGQEGKHETSQTYSFS